MLTHKSTAITAAQASPLALLANAIVAPALRKPETMRFAMALVLTQKRVKPIAAHAVQIAQRGSSVSEAFANRVVHTARATAVANVFILTPTPITAAAVAIFVQMANATTVSALNKINALPNAVIIALTSTQTRKTAVGVALPVISDISVAKLAAKAAALRQQYLAAAHASIQAQIHVIAHPTQPAVAFLVTHSHCKPVSVANAKPVLATYKYAIASVTTYNPTRIIAAHVILSVRPDKFVTRANVPQAVTQQIQAANYAPAYAPTPQKIIAIAVSAVTFVVAAKVA